MKLSKLMIGFFIIVLTTLAVIAATSYNFRAPSEFTTLTSTSVNFSTVFNQTNNDATVFNITIYNSSNDNPSRNYSKFTDSGNITISRVILNGTFWNLTNYTLKDNTRHWIFFNITNGSSTRGPILSDVTIFDIDTIFLKFRLGQYDTINFTLDTGEVSIYGNMTVGNGVIQLKNTTVDHGCTNALAGMIIYNESFWGCNGTDFVRLG